MLRVKDPFFRFPFFMALECFPSFRFPLFRFLFFRFLFFRFLSFLHPKHMGGWWRWALVSPDGVAPSRMVGVSGSVNLPLHHKSPDVLFWHRLTRVVPEKVP